MFGRDGPLEQKSLGTGERSLETHRCLSSRLEIERRSPIQSPKVNIDVQS